MSGVAERCDSELVAMTTAMTSIEADWNPKLKMTMQMRLEKFHLMGEEMDLRIVVWWLWCCR